MPQRLSPLEARRTVAVFCLLTAINGFQFQNYAAKIKVAETTFHASEADIKRRFRKLCLELHPDLEESRAAGEEGQPLASGEPRDDPRKGGGEPEEDI